MLLQFGFGFPYYLAHFTIGFGKRTLWLTIVSSNWNKVCHQKKDGQFQDFGACLSIFTLAYTDASA